MHKSWAIKPGRVGGNPAPVTILGEFGDKISNKAQNVFQNKITRHHVINIQVLQNFRNAAVDRQDEDMFRAIGYWAAVPLSTLNCSMQSKTAPKSFQKAVCWNPFNIVLGPSTEVRVGDPGDGFDDIHYREFGPASNERVWVDVRTARMEFNTHIERLKRINQLMSQYIAGNEPIQIRNSLMILLRDDTPIRFPTLHRLLRQKAEGAAYDAVQDRQLTEKHPRRLPQYSPNNLPGCLVDPSLWENVSITPPGGFQSSAHSKVNQSRLRAKVVPWVSKSYLPQLSIPPKPQFNGVLKPTASYPLNSNSAVTIGISQQKGRALLERQECSRLVTAEVDKAGPFAKKKGLILYVVGTKENGLWRDVVDNVASAAHSLVKGGYKLEVQPITHASFRDVQFRMHFQS